MINGKFYLHSFPGPCSNCVMLHNLTRFTPFLQLEATRMVSTEAGLGLGVVHPSLLLPSPEQCWFEYEAFCV